MWPQEPRQCATPCKGMASRPKIVETGEKLKDSAVPIKDSAVEMERSTARVEHSADRRTELAAHGARGLSRVGAHGLVAMRAASARALLMGTLPEWLVIATGTVFMLFSVLKCGRTGQYQKRNLVERTERIFGCRIYAGRFRRRLASSLHPGPPPPIPDVWSSLTLRAPGGVTPKSVHWEPARGSRSLAGVQSAGLREGAMPQLTLP